MPNAITAHRILLIGDNDKAFVTATRAYTAWELWLAGLTSVRGGAW